MLKASDLAHLYTDYLKLKRAKHWWGCSSYQRASGASRRAGGKIPQHFV